ncbi:MAG: 3-phosphoshikimate 1-carboxyvinyltransferase [Chitinophagia bacterium]|nr:3-phosphoshikimate 1-carboxyvinyltransferase [Chitinophagia bacterium]
MTTIPPCRLKGSVAPPPSKSYTQRAFAAAVLHNGTTVIENAGNSDDECHAIAIAAQLGATITPLQAGSYRVESKGIAPTGKPLHCGESGLSARLFLPIAALCDVPVTLTATGSLLHRPIERCLPYLTALGVACQATDNGFPITVKGRLNPNNITIDAGESSQFLSGLLMAYCFSATESATITVTELHSKPYIDMTIELLAQFGKHITHHNYKEFYINPTVFSHTLQPHIVIENDWSGAANFVVGGAINGSVRLTGLNPNSLQADRAVLDAIRLTGIEPVWENGSLIVESAPLNAFDFDATPCPDLFPVLAVLAACSKGDSRITGLHRLQHKESNRATAIQALLHTLNVSHNIDGNTLTITGSPTLNGGQVNTFNDHRITMAATIAALRTHSPITLAETNSVKKSYPNFFEDFLRGVRLTFH